MGAYSHVTKNLQREGYFVPKNKRYCSLPVLILLSFLPENLYFANAWIYDFKKDPLPLNMTYWIIGQVDIQHDGKTPSEVAFDLHPSVSNEEEPDFKLIEIGFAPTWVFDKLDDKERICNKDSFSIAKRPDTLSVRLSDSLEKKTLEAKTGSYYLWISNCGTKSMKGRTLEGTIKVKSSHGYLPPHMLSQQRMNFNIGIPAAVLCALWSIYLAAFQSSGADGGPTPWIISAIFACVAIRLMVAQQYASNSWNLEGTQSAGRIVVDFMVGLQICLTYTLYEFMCSQHYYTSVNSIAGAGGDDPAIMISGGAKKGPSPLDIGLLLLCNLGLMFGYLAVFVLTEDQFSLRPPAEFFDEAGKGEFGASGKTKSVFFPITRSDAVIFVGALCLLLPVMFFAERKEAVLKNDFREKIFFPCRSICIGIVLCIFVLSSILVYARSSVLETATLEILDEADTVLWEVGSLVGFSVCAFYLYSWNQFVGSENTKYAVISGQDVEMAQMDNDDVHEIVENYDPDRLIERKELS